MGAVVSWTRAEFAAHVEALDVADRLRTAELLVTVLSLTRPEFAAHFEARACAECNADAGEPCRPYCVGLDSDHLRKGE